MVLARPSTLRVHGLALKPLLRMSSSSLLQRQSQQQGGGIRMAITSSKVHQPCQSLYGCSYVLRSAVLGGLCCPLLACRFTRHQTLQQQRSPMQLCRGSARWFPPVECYNLRQVCDAVAEFLQRWVCVQQVRGDTCRTGSQQSNLSQQPELGCCKGGGAERPCHKCSTTLS